MMNAMYKAVVLVVMISSIPLVNAMPPPSRDLESGAFIPSGKGLPDFCKPHILINNPWPCLSLSLATMYIVNKDGTVTFI